MAFKSQVSEATMMCSWQQRPRRSSIFGSRLLTLADSNFRPEEGLIQWEVEH